MRRGLSTLDLAPLDPPAGHFAALRLAAGRIAASGAEQTEKPRVQRIVLGVRSQGGRGPSARRRPQGFSAGVSRDLPATVSAGEQSGKLDQVLERLSDYTESRQVMGQQVSNALV